MSPRPYDLGRRREAIDETRIKVLAAARELLVAPDGYARFTIDNVARIAGVARMTVYYRFKSKAGLLEALCDTLAMQAGMGTMMAEVFREPQPQPALGRFLEVLGHFYGSDRLLMRRLHGLSALDPDFEQVLGARQERRREGLRTLLKLLHAAQSAEWIERKAAALHAITDFTVYDSLAGPGREPASAVPLMLKLVQAALDAD